CNGAASGSLLWAPRSSGRRSWITPAAHSSSPPPSVSSSSSAATAAARLDPPGRGRSPSDPPGLGVVPCRLSVRLALHMLSVLASIPFGAERGSCQEKVGIPRPRYGKPVPLRGSTVVLAIVC